jgi:hypothetical protein
VPKERIPAAGPLSQRVIEARYRRQRPGDAFLRTLAIGFGDRNSRINGLS